MSLFNLLDVVWSLCTFPLWATYLMLTHAPDMVSDVLVSAFLYGKLSSNNKKASLLDHIAIPKRWFAHFYQFAVLLFSGCSLVLLSCLLGGDSAVPNVLHTAMDILVYNRQPTVPFSVILLVQLLLTAQVYRRCYECMFVSVYSDVKMHVWHYAVGFIFYTGVQFSVLSMTFDRTTFQLSLSDLLVPNVILGSLIFGLFYFIEGDTAQRFANFRKDSSGRVISKKHEAPSGGMFEYVSSPHYLAEIMIYNGLTVILWNFNLTWFNCLLWTWVNQMAMAFLTHSWYKKNFKDYPRNRTAIIPFLL